MNTVSVFNNAGRFVMEGSAALSAAGAVSSSVGDGLTVTKNGTGLYEFVFANPGGLILNRVLTTTATIRDAAVGTVKDCGVKSVTQSATDGSFKVIVRTVNAAGADVDEASDALTLDMSCVIGTTAMNQTV